MTRSRTKLELTRREREVDALRRAGKSMKETAEILGIGIETVRTHRKSVYACRKAKLEQAREAL